MPNAVTRIAAAAPQAAAIHFESQFAFETDCWDTHDAMNSGAPGFILLDVRSPALFGKGHVPGAVNLPHGKIIASRMNIQSRRCSSPIARDLTATVRREGPLALRA
jgi:3-mercaptopyruvate sulfurtransferase SseA